MTLGTALGLSGAVVLIGVAYVLGEQAVSRQDRTDRVTVVYWEKWTGDEGVQMRRIVDRFNKSQKRIFVKYLSISGVDSKTMLATAGGNPPDVAGLWHDQVYKFSDLKALTDLSQMAKEAGLTENYYIKGYWDEVTYKGGLWALPSTPASVALHVRSDLVPAEYATPETFPKTLEGMDELAKKITVRGKKGELIRAGFLPSNPGWWNWAWPGLFGGKLWDGEKPTVNTPELLRAYKWVGKYAGWYGAKAVTNFQSGFGNFSSPQDPFMEGKVAMEPNGPWKAKYIMVYKSNVPWFAVPLPYPKDRPDLANHTILAMDVLTIPRGAKHPKEAFEFIRFVQRQDVMEDLCSSHGKNSPLNKVSEHFFNTHPNKYIRLFDKLARSPQAVNIPKIGMYNTIASEVSNAFTSVNSGIATPKKALEDAQERVDLLWDKYKTQVLGQ